MARDGVVIILEWALIFNKENKMYYHPSELYRDPLNQNKIDAFKKRAKLLNASDWTQIPDAPLSPELKAAWATYRQQLRDITDQETYPDNIVWPMSPNHPEFVL